MRITPRAKSNAAALTLQPEHCLGPCELSNSLLFIGITPKGLVFQFALLTREADADDTVSHSNMDT